MLSGDHLGVKNGALEVGIGICDLIGAAA